MFHCHSIQGFCNDRQRLVLKKGFDRLIKLILVVNVATNHLLQHFLIYLKKGLCMKSQAACSQIAAVLCTDRASFMVE